MNRLLSISVVVTLGMGAGARSARAQEAAVAPPTVSASPTLAPGITAPTEPETPAPDVKDPVVALGLALGGTAVSVALVATNTSDGDVSKMGILGLIAAPSLGHAYTGNYARVLVAMGLRGAGLTAMLVGVLSSVDSVGCSECDDGDAATLFYGGIGLVAAGTLFSIIDAPLSARRVNERARNQLVIAPAPVTMPGQAPAPGLVVAGSF